MAWSSEQLVDAIRRAIIARHQDTVLMLCKVAVQRGDVVLGHRDDESDDPGPLLEEACRAGQLPVVRCLCELPPALGVHQQTRHVDVLCCAATRGHAAVVRYLCKLPQQRGVDPGAADYEAIRLAVSRCDSSVVRYLCQLPPQRGAVPPAIRGTMRQALVGMLQSWPSTVTTFGAGAGRRLLETSQCHTVLLVRQGTVEIQP